MMGEYNQARAHENGLMLQNGVRPLAFWPVLPRDKRTTEKILLEYDLIFFYEPLDLEWETLYVFKNPIILKIIKDLPENPKTAADHALLGFLLGYGVNEICDYIKKHVK